MVYVAIFGLTMIAVIVFVVPTIPPSDMHAGNSGAFRLLLFGVPTAVTFCAWAIGVLINAA